MFIAVVASYMFYILFEIAFVVVFLDSLMYSLMYSTFALCYCGGILLNPICFNITHNGASNYTQLKVSFCYISSAATVCIVFQGFSILTVWIIVMFVFVDCAAFIVRCIRCCVEAFVKQYSSCQVQN